MNDTEPSTAAFRVRLGLTALGLAGDRSTTTITQLRRAVIAAAPNDAYAARDALRNQALCAHLTTDQEHELTAVLASSGLGRRALTGDQAHDLTAAVHRAEEHLRTLLT